MLFSGTKDKRFMKSGFVKNNGFTLIEVLVAASLMIILCVGTLSVFSYVVKINRGENVRLQALSVLQQKVEFYRSLRFSPSGTSPDLTARTNDPVGILTGADGRQFNIIVTITDITPTFKEITITATPVVAESGYLSNLRTAVTIQRVRTN
jgi:prepilin-type N-terminal cleavage/methylation domain-containing protein